MRLAFRYRGVAALTIFFSVLIELTFLPESMALRDLSRPELWFSEALQFGRPHAGMLLGLSGVMSALAAWLWFSTRFVKMMGNLVVVLCGASLIVSVIFGFRFPWVWGLPCWIGCRMLMSSAHKRRETDM